MVTKNSLKKILAIVAIVCLPAGAAALTADKAQQGYLAPGAFDILTVLPPPPTQGDPRYDTDRAIFKSTRALFGTGRWEMATNDVKTSGADMMRDFSCAVGVSLTPQNAPHLLALIGKAGRDTGYSTNIGKVHFKRLRPYQIDDGSICQPKEELANSYDYPSGHTTWGWTWALILAEMAPDRASTILARGRAFGESRIVCGVHNASAVEAGRLTASATLAAVRATAEYRADFAAARAELTALRKTGTAPTPLACQTETNLVSQNIFHVVTP